MQEKEDWDFSDDFFFLLPPLYCGNKLLLPRLFFFSFRVKSVSLSRHEHAATNIIKVTTIGSAHNNEYFLLLVREFPFPYLPFYHPEISWGHQCRKL